jgi:outer membrane protein assembly factor BamD
MRRYHLFIMLMFAILTGCATSAPANKSAEIYYTEGEEFYTAKKYDDAIAAWKKVKESYTSPELTATAELKIADAQYDDKNYVEAAASYESFRKFHPKHVSASYALFRVALCNFNQIERIDTDQTPIKNSITLFETFLKEYPLDPLAAEAREKLQGCRMKQLQYEIYVGRFYLNTHKYRAAIKRFEEALVTFPGAPLHDETLRYLGEAYLRSGERDKGREAFNRLFLNYGTSEYINSARKVMDKYY